MLSSRQTQTFWRNPLPPCCNRTELTEEKTAYNKGKGDLQAWSYPSFLHIIFSPFPYSCASALYPYEKQTFQGNDSNDLLTASFLSSTLSDCYVQITPLFPCKKAGLNKKKTFCTFDLHIRKKLVKCYIWSIALYGTATWTLWKEDQNTWKILKCGTEDEYSISVGLIVRTKKY